MCTTNIHRIDRITKMYFVFCFNKELYQTNYVIGKYSFSSAI